MNSLNAHTAHQNTPNTGLLDTERLQARIAELEAENAGLKNLWKDARIPVMKALRLQAENESLKAQLMPDEIGGKEGLNLVMALQPLLVAYANASMAYLVPRAELDIDQENALYHTMKVAETAIHWFVNSRHAASQVAEIAQLQVENTGLKNTMIDLAGAYAALLATFQHPDYNPWDDISDKSIEGIHLMGRLIALHVPNQEAK